MTKTNFVELTELSNEMVSKEQVERIARRYSWAASFVAGKDVLEVACGTGQGVGLLARTAHSVTAGDYSEDILKIAREHYGARFIFRQFDAQALPFPNDSFDVLIIFEALYYIPNPEKFFLECSRVLRPNGVLLISNANKDLYDFNPSPHSYIYHGVLELDRDLRRHGFSTKFFGDTPIGEVSLVQQILRPVKAVAAKTGLIPKSMTAKRLLKKLIFGKLVRMPAEIEPNTSAQIPPNPIETGFKDSKHKVIFCCARLVSKSPSC